MKYWPAYDFDKVLDNISWSNINMLLATIPSYETKTVDEVEEIAPEDEEAVLRKLIGN